MAIIPGTIPVTGTFAPTDTIDTFAIMDMTYVYDGLRNVADKTERNAITDERRKAGMIVGTQDSDEYWKLLPGPWNGTDTDWELWTVNGGGVTFLSELDDVVLMSPIIDGDVLTYDAMTGMWINLPNTGVSADGNGIYDGNGSLSGPTVATMGGNQFHLSGGTTKMTYTSGGTTITSGVGFNPIGFSSIGDLNNITTGSSFDVFTGVLDISGQGVFRAEVYDNTTFSEKSGLFAGTYDFGSGQQPYSTIYYTPDNGETAYTGLQADPNGELLLTQFFGPVTTVPTGSDHALFIDPNGYIKVSTFADLSTQLGVGSNPSIQTPDDKFLNAIETVSDGDLASNGTVTNTPIDGCYVEVRINGIEYEVGNGVDTKVCYFADPNSSPRVPRGFSSSHPNGQVQAGDQLYWNGSVIGFELLNGWRVSFHYLTS